MPAPKLVIIVDVQTPATSELARLPHDYATRSDLVVTSAGKVLKQRDQTSIDRRKIRRAARLIGVESGQLHHSWKHAKRNVLASDINW
ncbi:MULTISPECIES: hypothetical protein [unclassified Bradyrhizobium]|uniref:hypothetical protein n=1 Tax=unclassified Bradyrhizobium TaxID=2631580 RepID=UPI002916E084|nr:MULTISPECIES: hypothetical protein [unclassified Bradyrhizobium]